jgi:hypothetical protein
MTTRIWLTLAVACIFTHVSYLRTTALACCAAPPSGKPVVNADQAVLIIWDAATKTEHFIRRASFKSEADDFGFLVPTPSQPELDESGNEVFPYLQKLTEPEKLKRSRPSEMSCGCGSKKSAAKAELAAAVNVLEEKVVAGFKAVVLETTSANALAHWLKDNGYAFSPEVEAWAKPYVEAGWKITALKVAKDKVGSAKKTVAASALRMSFKTNRPLFPYREPDSTNFAQALGASKRLLRIYFLADGRYQGELTKDVPWTGQVAWANHLSPGDRKRALELLKLPETTGPAEWYLTEFEDLWPYRVAPADVTFSRSSVQDPVRRPPIIEYVASPWPADGMAYALAAVVVLPAVFRRLRRGRQE